MSSILSPEEIYELDTFTLQEKIDEIEALANNYLYRQILQLAKLELLERLEIEEFGRKLVNDEIKIEVEEVKLPPLSLNRQIGTKKSVNPMNEMMRKLQQCMISQQQLNKIVKTSTNHSNKFFKNQRRTSEVIKKPVSKKIQMPVKVREKVHIKIPQQIIPQKPKQNEALTKKDKLKQQIKAIQIQYRENDVYEDMMAPISPQKLIDCSCLDETIQQAIENNSKLTLQESIKDQIYQKEQIICEKIEIIGSPKSNKTILMEQIQKQEKYRQEQRKIIDIFQLQKRNTTIKTDLIDFNKREIQTINLDNLSQQKNTQKQKQVKLNKQSRSISLKNIIHPSTSRKQTKANNQKDKDKKDLIVFALPQSLHKQTQSDTIKSKIKMQHCVSNTISNFKMILNPTFKESYFPYHQIIPNFNKLFPHSKNLLVTLRNIEENLKQHFSKNIFEKSKNSQLARLDANEQTYKVISESQKAKKYHNLFDIDLTSFYERGKVMLNRVSCSSDFNQERSALFYRVVRTKEDVYDIISSGFHRVMNWYELVHGQQLKSSWNLLWTWSKPQIDFGDLFYFQRVNHFIGNKQIARKDLLKKNIQKIKKLGIKMKSLFDIIPETYLLPGQSIQFIKKFKEYSKQNSNNFWILKPVGLSRGRGISVVSKLQEIVFSEPIVLQRYLKNPLLLDGYKFDMRIYVLVTSMNPLQAYIYRQGFARISTQKYSNNEKDIGNKFMHLTNFSINKENVIQKQEKDMTFQQKLGGCKISLKMLQSKLQEKRINWKIIENQIEQIVLKSLIACMNSIPSNPNCFQLFGYDIFVDEDLKCWLLEVNSSPSLEKDYTLDEIIKQQLIDDTIQLIQPIKYDRQKLLQVVERRRKELQGLKSHINTNNNSIQQLDQDLHLILHGKPLRKYGQSNHPPNYKKIAPGNTYFQIIKAVQQYKIDPIIKGQ